MAEKKTTTKKAAAPKAAEKKATVKKAAAPKKAALVVNGENEEETLLGLGWLFKEGKLATADEKITLA